MVGTEREMQWWVEKEKCNVLVSQTQNEQLKIVRTYCDHDGSSHGAWKLGRQSYDTDGVSQATL